MGFRTPGEKTAFEVDKLDSAGLRIFNEKILNFEINFLEPLMNTMLEYAQRNLTAAQQVPVPESDLGKELFMEISREAITGSGQLYPMGTRHFVARRKLLQELTAVFDSRMGEFVAPHTSGKQLAELIEDSLGVERFGIFQDNIAITEQAETQRLSQSTEQAVMEESMIDPANPDFVPEEPLDGP